MPIQSARNFLYCAALLAVFTSGCSTLEPSMQIDAESVKLYADEKNDAEKFITAMQSKKKYINTEETVYTLGALGLAAAGGIASVFDASGDLVTGLLAGSATSAGINAYLNPADIVLAYQAGITSINCAIQVTDKLNENAHLIVNLAPTSTTTVLFNQKPEDFVSLVTNEIQTAKAASDRSAYVSLMVTASATQESASIFNQSLSNLRVIATNNSGVPEVNSAQLLHDAVNQIILGTNKRIQDRDRDRDALKPSNLLKEIKEREEEIKKGVEVLNANIKVINSHIPGQAFLAGQANNVEIQSLVVQQYNLVVQMEDNRDKLKSLELKDPFASCNPAEESS